MCRNLAHGCLFPNCVSCAEEIIRKCNFFAAISFLFDLNNLQITNSTSASRITTYRYNLLKKVFISDFSFCLDLFFKNVIGGEGITYHVHEVRFPFSYLQNFFICICICLCLYLYHCRCLCICICPCICIRIKKCERGASLTWSKVSLLIFAAIQG